MDEITYELLKIFIDYDSISITELAKLLKLNYMEIVSEIIFIFEKNYISKTSNEPSSPSVMTSQGDLPINAQLKITTKGRIAYENYKNRLKKDKSQSLVTWLTLFISAATLIVSVLGVLLNIFPY